MITAAACLALAIYHEGRSEPIDAQLAIAEVIINRAYHPGYPDTICGVVTEHRAPISKPWACQFSFYCDGKDDTPHNKEAWATAETVAARALGGDTLGHGATHYHTLAVSPAWRHELTPVGIIGAHIFYTDGRCVLALGCSRTPPAKFAPPLGE
jgi:spore germination cell wall hydrolase CwlJ-like protein